MSGGAYDYVYSRIDDLAGEIRDAGGCSAAPPHLRRAFKEHLRVVALAVRAIEWNDSGDGDRDEEKIIREVLGPERALDAARENAEAAAKALAAEIGRAQEDQEL